MVAISANSDIIADEQWKAQFPWDDHMGQH